MASLDPFQLSRLADELVLTESSENNGELRIDDFPDDAPLSHDNPYLVAPDFDVQRFLLSRSHTTLPELRTELRDYLSQLKEDLVKLINNDYEAFISLSTDLKGEGERLQNIHSPLGQLQDEVLLSKNDLSAIQDAINKCLAKRVALREEKTLLQLLLKLSESITRLENLLLISPPSEEVGARPEGDSFKPTLALEQPEDRSRAKHLGRVAGEYMQLVYLASKARQEQCQYVDEVNWRIQRIQSTLSSDLDHVFATTLSTFVSSKGKLDVERTKVVSDLTECLKAYNALGLWRDAEDVLRREVVRGFVKKTFFPGALNGSHSPILPHTPFPAATFPPQTPYTPFSAFVSSEVDTKYGSDAWSGCPHARFLEAMDEPLARLFTQALRFVERDLVQIMSIAEKVSAKIVLQRGGERDQHQAESDQFSVTDGFDILANVVWEEMGRALIDEFGNILFTSGRPNELRKHYELSQAFLRSLEFASPSIRSIDTLRTHPMYIAFQQRWQLPVYFQMRWKDIIASLEETLTSKQLVLQDSEPFATSQTSGVWTAIASCWQPDIVIPELSHRFWRLTLQVLGRYKTWLSQYFASSTPSLVSIDKSLAKSRSTAPLSGTSSEHAPVPEAANMDATLQDCAVIMHDLKALRSRLLSLWREQISAMLPEGTGSERAEELAAQEALQGSLTGLLDLTPILFSRAVGILTQRCCQGLLPVRSIPSQFRAMSSKRMPTEPSYFVATILRPLKQFFGVDGDAGPGVILRAEYLSLISTQVFEGTCERYVYFLSAMKKTEESLRRLKKGKKGGFTPFGRDDDGKDEERIQAQMTLDVDGFGQDAQALGVDLDNSQSFKELRDMVTSMEDLHN